MDHVDFNWKSDLSDVPYRIGITFTDTQALNLPSMNISNVGFVPTSWETIRLDLKCSGRISTEANFTLQVGDTTVIVIEAIFCIN